VKLVQTLECRSVSRAALLRQELVLSFGRLFRPLGFRQENLLTRHPFPSFRLLDAGGRAFV
jgi:hypothetical protein